MGAASLKDLSRCAIHTATNKPWDLRTCCERYADAGIGGVSVWRDVVSGADRGVGVDEAARIISGSGLAVPAYVRGGFFVAESEAGRRAAMDENKRCLDEAAAIGAEQVVLVVGALPGVALIDARRQVADGIAACLDHARGLGVKMSIEPLHPMYAADKSCINRIAEARAMCEQLDDAMLGVAVDVYHVWWDPDLASEVDKLGKGGWLFGFHVCDWRVETRHLLTDRGLMGDGCIDLAGIGTMVEAAGFSGFNEVEVFSEQYWAWDQDAYLDLIVERYREHVG